MITAALLLIAAGNGLSEPVGIGDGWPDFGDPVAQFGWPEMGYLIESAEDQRLHDAGIRAFRNGWIRRRSEFSTEIIGIIAGRLFVMPQTYRGLFAAREYACGTCWNFQPLESGHANGVHAVAELSLRAAGLDPETFDTILILTQYGAGVSRTEMRRARPLSELVRAGYYRTAEWYAAGTPDEGLYSLPIRKIATIYPQPTPPKRQTADPWYLERLGPSSPEWIDLSLRSLKGTDAREFFREHKYVPMDRSLRDMQYGPLRNSVPVLKYAGEIDDPTEPPDSKYWEERARWLTERRTYNDSLDELLGVAPVRVPVRDILTQERADAGDLFRWLFGGQDEN